MDHRRINNVEEVVDVVERPSTDLRVLLLDLYSDRNIEISFLFNSIVVLLSVMAVVYEIYLPYSDDVKIWLAIAVLRSVLRWIVGAIVEKCRQWYLYRCSPVVITKVLELLDIFGMVIPDKYILLE